MAELLLKCGANPNWANEYEMTTLLAAVSSDNIEMVELLIKYGVDVTYKTSRGYTALSNAIDMGNYLIIQLLLDARNKE